MKDELRIEQVWKTMEIPDEVILRLTYLRGVGIEKATRLIQAGYETIEKIAAANKDELASALDYSISWATNLIHKAREVVKKIESGELTWDEVLESVSRTRRQMDALKRPEWKKTPPSREIPDEVILHLTYLDDVGNKKAKQLVHAGYETIEEIASANKYHLASALGYYTATGVFLAEKLIYRASRVVEEIESGELTWDEVLERARQKRRKS